MDGWSINYESENTKLSMNEYQVPIKWFNGEPSSARCLHWSKMKVISFCFEIILFCQKSKQFSFSSGTSRATWRWRLPILLDLLFLQLASWDVADRGKVRSSLRLTLLHKTLVYAICRFMQKGSNTQSWTLLRDHEEGKIFPTAHAGQSRLT